MSTTRRHFLGAAAGISGALAAQSPNDRVRIALIGASGQGSDDARTALDTGGVEMESKSYGVHVII